MLHSVVVQVVVIVVSLLLLLLLLSMVDDSGGGHSGGRTLVMWVTGRRQTEDEGLREIFETCVCACICVNDYISIVNYDYCLIVFTVTIHNVGLELHTAN